MRKPLAALLATAALAAQSPSTDVAMGVYPFLVGNMDNRIQEIVGNCTAHGIDTIYVSVFRATGPSTGTLWVTDSAGDWNPAWGPVRTSGNGIHLQNLIAACHAANLRVVGVLKCFDATVQPTDGAHKQYLLDVIDYFVDAWQPNGRPVYDLDGIALDYIRFVGSSTGNDPLQVTNFLAQVRQHIGALSLHCYLIASRYTFDGGTYNGQFQSYNTIISSLSSQYGQHWQQMAQYVDVLMPMAYTADGSIYNTSTLHQAYVQQTAVVARNACTLAGFPGRRVCPTIRTYSDANETCTPATITASIQGALLGGGNGYQSFRYGTMLPNASWWTAFAQFAAPGQNWPIPELTQTGIGITANVDPTNSRDADQASNTLQVRFDWDGDGAFDTGWQNSAATLCRHRHPGVWTTAMQLRDAQGHVAATRRRITAGGVLNLNPPYVSAGFGGTVQVQIQAGAAAAGSNYLVLASLAGSNPGTLWQPGFPVPLNVDWLTYALAAAPNSPPLLNGAGVLDGNGAATATVTLPPGLASGIAGNTVTFTVVAFGAGVQPHFAGEAEGLLILP